MLNQANVPPSTPMRMTMSTATQIIIMIFFCKEKTKTLFKSTIIINQLIKVKIENRKVKISFDVRGMGPILNINFSKKNNSQAFEPTPSGFRAHRSNKLRLQLDNVSLNLHTIMSLSNTCIDAITAVSRDL